MFSKTKEEAAPAQGQPKRIMKSAPSIISMDMAVTGTMTAGGDIQIDGKVDGDITTGSLTIGEKAVVNGEIMAEEVVVRGKIIGSIRARKVQLCSTCHVEGDIFHQALAVETGAYFEGNCRHSDDPLKEQVNSRRSPVASASRPAPVAALPRSEAAPAPTMAIPASAPTHGPRLHGGLLGRPSPLINRNQPKNAEAAEASPNGKGK
jgi:cytoskeletal protein CcmA (bactofilin family)